jgi:predicted nucleotidyltransferase
MDDDTAGTPPPTAAQRALIERSTEVAATDKRILAAWLVGSFATGTADAFSDVDLHCAVTDDSADWFREHWAEVARKITPLVLAAPIPGVIGGFTITPEWLHLDVVFHPRAEFDPRRVSGLWPLFDRTGQLLPPQPVPGDDVRGDPYFPAGAVDFDFYLLGNLAVVLGRGSFCWPRMARSCAATSAWCRSCWPRTGSGNRTGTSG